MLQRKVSRSAPAGSSASPLGGSGASAGTATGGNGAWHQNSAWLALAALLACSLGLNVLLVVRGVAPAPCAAEGFAAPAREPGPQQPQEHAAHQDDQGDQNQQHRQHDLSAEGGAVSPLEHTKTVIRQAQQSLQRDLLSMKALIHSIKAQLSSEHQSKEP